MNGFLEADSFTIGSALIFTQIAYWSDQASAADFAGSTYWAIYSNVAGSPGAVLFSGSSAAAGVATSNTTLGLNEFAYQFAVNFTLAPATYWLALHNGPVNTIPQTQFLWAWESGVSSTSKSQDLSVVAAPWVSNSASLAFQLTGSATPEPASMFLVGSGLLAAWLTRRKLSARR
jgi:hypothetical protein